MTRPIGAGRALDAMPDTVDFRDRVYEPTLVEVFPRRPLDPFRELRVPILDQGAEGACTGFALATVANSLLRRRSVDPDTTEVSARMFYEMAKRYNEWPGEAYSGSSARGAVKGWHKHGVCARELWDDVRRGNRHGITESRAADAMRRPLGAYYRINHLDLVAMHSAITEVGILFATARVQEDWGSTGGDGCVPFDAGTQVAGGHAFAVVGYDEHGFWFLNSWGEGWGARGFGRIRYDDWLANGMDVWVARLGAPARLGQPGAAASMRAGAPRAYESYVYCALRPHVVTVGNDGCLRSSGTYGLEPAGLRRVLREEAPARMKGWKRKRVIVYAHGGLVPEDSAVQRIADYREAMMAEELYPLCFVWRSDLWTTLGNIISDAVVTRTEGVFDATRNFLLDRIDDTIEPVARTAGAKALWDEMKENAERATTARDGAARLVAQELAALVRAGEIDEVHLVGHSAGAIFLGPFAQFLASQGAIAGGEDGREARV